MWRFRLLRKDLLKEKYIYIYIYIYNYSIHISFGLFQVNSNLKSILVVHFAVLLKSIGKWTSRTFRYLYWSYSWHVLNILKLAFDDLKIINKTSSSTLTSVNLLIQTFLHLLCFSECNSVKWVKIKDCFTFIFRYSKGLFNTECLI